MAAGTALFILSLIAEGARQQQAKKTQALQEEARDIELAGQTIEASRQVRRELRQARVRRAQILQASENTGVSGGSGVSGAIGSIGSRLASAQSQLAEGQRTATSISNTLQSAADSQFQEQLLGGVSDLFGTASRNENFTQRLDDAFNR